MQNIVLGGCVTPRSAACTFLATFPYQYPRHKLFKVFKTCPVPLHFLSVVFFIPAHWRRRLRGVRGFTVEGARPNFSRALSYERSEGEWRQIKEEGEGGSLISLYIKFYLSSEENMGRWICQETKVISLFDP